jgi:transposase
MESYPSNSLITEQSYRRVEVLTGTRRRRRWSAEEKARIVAESSARGVVARSVALRHGVHPNQLYAWRREFRVTEATAEAGFARGFVPVAVAEEAQQAPRRGAGRVAGTIEIEVGGTVLRVAPGVEMDFLSAVLRAVSALA